MADDRDIKIYVKKGMNESAELESLSDDIHYFAYFGDNTLFVLRGHIILKITVNLFYTPIKHLTKKQGVKTSNGTDVFFQQHLPLQRFLNKVFLFFGKNCFHCEFRNSF